MNDLFLWKMNNLFLWEMNNLFQWKIKKKNLMKISIKKYEEYKWIILLNNDKLWD